MFPDNSLFESNTPTDSRATDQAIKVISTFVLPTAADLVPEGAVPRRASKTISEAKNKSRGRQMLGLLIMAGAIAGFIFATPAWFVWAGLLIWGWFLFGKDTIDAEPFRQAFTEADLKVQDELNAFIRRNGLVELFKLRSELDTAIASYQVCDDTLARELMILKSNREARQRQAFLDRFSIRRANIPGIGPAKTSALISFGIETAADVKHYEVLRVPGFGEKMTAKLLSWRRGHEARFRYDLSPNQQDIADERALRGRFAADKAKLEKIIRDGARTLRNAQDRLNKLSEKAKNDNWLKGAADARAQAARDLNVLGLQTPTSSVGLTVDYPRTPPMAPRQSPPRYQPAPPPRPIPTPTQQVPKSRSRSTASTPSCPKCGATMRRRSGRYGRFWGCSRYPSCRGTRN